MQQEKSNHDADDVHGFDRENDAEQIAAEQEEIVANSQDVAAEYDDHGDGGLPRIFAEELLAVALLPQEVHVWSERSRRLGHEVSVARGRRGCL